MKKHRYKVSINWTHADTETRHVIATNSFQAKNKAILESGNKARYDNGTTTAVVVDRDVAA